MPTNKTRHKKLKYSTVGMYSRYGIAVLVQTTYYRKYPKLYSQSFAEMNELYTDEPAKWMTWIFRQIHAYAHCPIIGFIL